MKQEKNKEGLDLNKEIKLKVWMLISVVVLSIIVGAYIW